MSDDLRQIDKFKFLALHKGAKNKLLAKLIRRLYLNPRDNDALAHYQRFQTFDSTIPEVFLEVETLSCLYHELMRDVKPDIETPTILPQVRRLDHTATATPFLPYCIYLDQIRSGHNLGSIIRTCEAFRIGSIHLSKNCPKKEHKDVLKTSLGAEHHVEIFENVELNDLPRPWIAIETCSDALDYAKFCFPDTPATLILGNEEFGISNEILQQVDFYVEIPLCGIKNSLNVANAFAILASVIHRRLRS